ncbi:MAG: RNA polymerase sporulation sigma factor SigK [Clostridiales bacterium]|nr:RNA polymerase sporulation sigma factor SigK [Clostridiales bacterium]
MFSFLNIFSDILFFLGYVGQNRAFPPPLSKEEEGALIVRMEEGDDDARVKLIVHNLRLAAHIAKKYARAGRDADDITSIGTIGLIKAVNTFNHTRGSLSGYAARCIENEIRMAFRSERKLVQEVPLDEPLGKDKDGNELSLAEILESDAQSVFDAVQARLEADLVRELLQKHLTARERDVLSMRCGLAAGHPMPQREVAQALDISRSYVSRIETKAIGKLKKALQDGEAVL